jgi:hypothetical protein
MESPSNSRPSNSRSGRARLPQGPPLPLPSLVKAQHRAAAMRTFMDSPVYKIYCEILLECEVDQMQQLVICKPEDTQKHQAAYQAYHFCRFLPEYVIEDEHRVREEQALTRTASREETSA